MLVKVKHFAADLSQDTKCYSILILSCCFFSLSSLFTDLIEHLPVQQILWWRFCFTTMIVLIYNQFSARPGLVFSSWRDNKLLMSALFGTITASCTVFALRTLPIGEATLLLTTAPFFTVFLSSIFLDERLHATDYISLLAATLGVVLVAQPDFIFGAEEVDETKSPLFYVAIGAALTRGFFKAAKFVAVSVTGNTVPTHVIVLYLSMMGLVSTSCTNAYLYMQKDIQFIMPCKMDMLYAILMSGCYFMQQLCVCQAMRYGKPAKASLLKYFDIVLPLIFQVTIFHQYPNLWSILGCSLIVAAMLTVLMVQRSYKSEKLSPQNKRVKANKSSSGEYTILQEEDPE